VSYFAQISREIARVFQIPISDGGEGWLVAPLNESKSPQEFRTPIIKQPLQMRHLEELFIYF
jgi:hypothetical protein